MKRILHAFSIVILLAFRPIFKRIRWRVLFVVNSATDETIELLFPESIAHMLTLAPIFKSFHSPIGFIFSKKGISLIVANASSNDEIWTRSELVKKQTKALTRWKAKRIALGGVLPSAIAKHGVSEKLDDRFCLETHGTVFMLSKSIELAINKHPNLALDKRPISIIGSGYTGQALAKHLEKKDVKIHLFDVLEKVIFPKSKNVKFLHSKFHEISSSGLIILLSTKGDDGIRSIEPHLLPNMVLLSDTYPKVSTSYIEILEHKGVVYYECYANIKGAYTFPTYGHAPTNLLGGCFIQSYVESFADKPLTDYGQFTESAHKLGLTGVIHNPTLSKEYAS